MPRLLRHTLVSTRDLLISAGPLIVLGVLLLWGAYVLLDPAPPKKVVLATGPEQGDFAEFGKRYQAELKHFGIAVELRATAGAGENLKLLRDSAQHVDLAFVRGGAGDAILAVDEQNDSVPLVSLGSLFYEPVWIFYSEAAARHVLDSGTLNQLAQLRTLRINVGPRGSGGSNLFSKLLHANRIERETLQLSHLAPTPAVVALLAGDIDALVFVSAPESPLVQMLLQTPSVRLFDFAQAEAYARRFAFLSAQQLPRGIVDLAADLPPHDVHLLAPTAVLAARDGTHPALIQLFVQGLVRAGASVSEPAGGRHAARARSGALLPQRPAAAAALSAVLVGQSDRPHVGRAGVDRRRADPVVARRAAAVHVPDSFARVSLVRATARDRGRSWPSQCRAG